MAIQENADNQPIAKGSPIGALALKAEMAAGRMQEWHSFRLGEYHATVFDGQDALWLIVRDGGGGFALRTAHTPGAPLRVERLTAGADGGVFTAESALGTFRVTIQRPDADKALVRCVTTLTPSADIRLAHWPRRFVSA